MYRDSFGKSSSCDHKAHAFGDLGHCFLRGVPASYSEPAPWEEENKKRKQSKPVAARLSPTSSSLRYNLDSGYPLLLSLASFLPPEDNLKVLFWRMASIFNLEYIGLEL